MQGAFKKGTTIEGTILEKIKGGMRVDVGVNAFLPDSQIDLKPILNFLMLLEKHLNLKSSNATKKKGNSYNLHLSLCR